MTTITLLRGQPDYDWQVLLRAAFAQGALGSSNTTSATLTVVDYDGNGNDLLVSFAGTDISENGTLFTDGEITSLTLSLGAENIADVDLAASPVPYDEVNPVLVLFDNDPSASGQVALDAFQLAFFRGGTTIVGSDENDQAIGAYAYASTIQGGDGYDTLEGGANNDSIEGGADGDRLIGGEGADTLDGGDDGDSVDYWQEQNGYGVAVHVDLSTGTATDTYGDTDTLINIEEVTGTRGNDTLIAGDGYQGFRGFEGNDTYQDSGDPSLWVYYGNEDKHGASHGIIVNLSGEAVIGVAAEGTGPQDVNAGQALDGFGDTDTLINVHAIRGSDFGDWIRGTDGNDHFQMQRGDDTIDGSGGRDTSDYAHDIDESGDAQDRGVIVNLSGSELTDVEAQGTGPRTVASGQAVDGFGDTDTLINIEQIIGTHFDDYLVAGNDGNKLEGESGDDTIIGGTGNDTLNGGAGKDTLLGNGGHDELDGGEGDDSIVAGEGIDYGDWIEGSSLHSGTGNDTLVGGSGGDLIRLADGTKDVTGNGGWDLLAFEDGEETDQLTVHVTAGGDGAGTITGTFNGNAVSVTFNTVEAVRGADGDDAFYADLGSAGASQGDEFWLNGGPHRAFKVVGGAGNDSFVDNSGVTGNDDVPVGVLRVDYQEEQWLHKSFSNDGGNHTYGDWDGEPGVIVNMTTGTVEYDGGQELLAGTARDTFGDIDTITGVHTFSLTDAADRFYAGDDGYSLEARRGDDTIIGGAGVDDFSGGQGNDSLEGGGSWDYLGGGDGNDTLIGGAGGDVLRGENNEDWLVGGEGDDELDGGDGFDNVDYFKERDGASEGSNGITIDWTTGHATDAYGNTDTFQGIESVHGTNDADVMIGDDGEQTFHGYGGNDSFTGGGGRDTIHYHSELDGWRNPDPEAGVTIILDDGTGENGEIAGHAIDGYGDTDTFTSIEDAGGSMGADSIVGSAQDNSLSGEQGADTIEAGDGNDVVQGGKGNDSLTGGSGEDRFFFEQRAGEDGDGNPEVGDGEDVITDFDVEHDRIEIVRLGERGPFDYLTFDKLMQAATEDVGGNTTLHLGEGDSITLLGVIKDELEQHNFQGLVNGTEVRYDRAANELTEIAHRLLTEGEVEEASDTIFRVRFTEFGNDQVFEIHGEGFVWDNGVLTAGTAHDFLITDHGDLVVRALNGTADYDLVNGLVDEIINGEPDWSVFGLDIATGGLDFTGSPDNDVFEGSEQHDELRGRRGDDTLYGNGGDDYLRGDEGGDENGNDELYGGDGNDSFKGGGGADLVDGGDGRDRIEYNSETTFTGDSATHGVIVNLSGDTLEDVEVAGIDGPQTVESGTAFDTRGFTDTLISIEDVEGTGYSDYIVGDDGDNELKGEDGRDTLIGGGGNDYLRGDEGGFSDHADDLLVGGDGDDHFKGGSGNDTIDGGADRDRVEYNSETTWTGDNATHGVIVNLSDATLEGVSVSGIPTTDVEAGTAIDTRGFVDTLIDIEDIEGTDYQDIIVGSSGDNQIDGLGGDDTLIGGGGHDELHGGDGNDLIDGTGPGVQQDDGWVQGSGLHAGDGDDTVLGSEGGDFIELAGGTDTVTGNGGNDLIAFERNNGSVVVHFTDAGDGTGTINGTHNGHAVDVSFEGIEGARGTQGSDTFFADAGAAAPLQGDTFWLDDGDDATNDEHRVFRVSGGAGSDSFIDNSGVPVGIMRVDYEEEQWLHEDFNGDHTYGEGDNEPGVTVNMTDGTEEELASHTARDTFGDIDSINGVRVFSLSNAGDVFYAGDEGYSVDARRGDDTVHGGAGNDNIGLNDGDDWVNASEGNDWVGGGSGNDTIYGGGGRDELNGEDGDDLIVAGDGVENGDGWIDGSGLHAGRGNDTIVGGNGSDFIDLEAGVDEEVSGNDGWDLVVYRNNGSDADHITVHLTGAGEGTIAGEHNGEAVGVVFDTVEAIRGTAGNDTFIADLGSEGAEQGDSFWLDGQEHRAFKVTGGAGDDTFTDNSGNPAGVLKLDYQEEQWQHASYDEDNDGERTYGDDAGENGVAINMTGDEVAGLESHTASDTFGDTDQIDGIRVFSLTETGDAFYAGDEGYSVEARGGDDTLIGGAGNDEFNSGAGNDSLIGNGGDDWLNGEDGDDTLVGGEGNDGFAGGAGTDSIDGGEGDNDYLEYHHEGGGAGVMVNLQTGTAIDTYGNAEVVVGIEEVTGTNQADTLIGTDRADHTWFDNAFRGLGGDDIIDAQGGFDLVYYDLDDENGGHSGVAVDLGAGTATDGFGDHDTLSGVEGVQGTKYADHLIGNAAEATANFFQGLAGADTIEGTVAFDIADYTQDHNREGGEGAIVANLDTVARGGFDAGTIRDGFGDTDTVSSIDLVRGTAQGDTFYGNAAVATEQYFEGQAGADTLVGGGAYVFADYFSDQNYGASHGVVADLEAGTVVDGFGDTDTLTGIRNISASQFDDTITGSSADNRILGNDGDDSVDGAGGDDSIVGGAGNDTISGGAGSDLVEYKGTIGAGNITSSGGMWHIAGGDEGDDTVSGVESIVHAGGRFVLVGNGGFADLAAAVAGGQPGDIIVIADDTPQTVDQSASTDDLSINLQTSADVDLETGSGDDTVSTGSGDDTVKTGDGNDAVSTGDGTDTIIGGSGNGDDVYDGGLGTDTVIYSSATSGIVVDLNTANRSGTAVSGADGAGPNADTVGNLLAAAGYGATTPVGIASGEDIGTDALIGIENVVGGSGSDQIAGNSGNNALDGAGGDDTLSGGGGSDTLTGGTGDDTFAYTGGAVTIVDFDPSEAEEVVNISAIAGIDDFADLIAALVDEGNLDEAVFDFGGGNTLTLSGVNWNDLGEEDFVFNEAPVITTNGGNPISANADENQTAVLVIEATDSDAGDQLTFSLGGPDAALFAIDGETGVVTFVSAPNFEAPQDVGTDGTYNITVTVDDGAGGTDSIAIAVTVADKSEAPTLANEAAGTLTDTSVTDTFAPVAGSLDGSDSDAGTTLTYQIAGQDPDEDGDTEVTTTYGTLTVHADGTYSYIPNAGAINALTSSTSDVIGVSVSDGTSTDEANLTITIVGVNDAAVISGTASGNSTEGGGATTGTLLSTDVDGTANSFTAVGTPTASANGYGTFTMTAGGTWTYTVDSDDPAVEALGNGQQLADSFVVTAADGTPKTVNITISGSNDAAVITGDDDGEVIEAGGVSNGNPGTATATGELGSTDVDGTTDLFTAVTTATASTGGYGTFTVTTAGVWTYALNNNNATVQALGAGATLNDSFVVTAADGTPKTVSVTITGTNDAAVIGGQTSSTAIEAGGANNGQVGNATAIGTLTSTDVDGTANSFTAVSTATASIGAYGTYKMTAGGTWTYTLNNNNATVNALENLEQLNDSFVVTAADGTQQTITVTIYGQNDDAVITGEDEGSVAEAGGVANGTAGSPTATGELSSTDVDGTDDLFTAVTTATASTGGYGTFTVTTAGVWTYTLNDSNATVQGLKADEELSDSFEVDAADGTSHTVLITITGANDVPTITSLGGGVAGEVSVVEGATAVTTVAVSDPDGNSITYSIVGGDDATRFAINATTGALSFVTAPNYESPADVGGNNVYDVIVRASDGSLHDEQAIAVTVTDFNETGSVINGTNSNNNLTGTALNDTLNGAGGNDTLNGLAGDDSLVGGAGNDSMIGGAGDDIYVVEQSGDSVSETAGNGTDTVQSAITFSLATLANVENVTLTGTLNNSATGNAGANVLTGNTGNNTLTGGGGNDTLIGGGGNDSLDGGSGDDSLVGGAGNDIYVVDSLSDVISEVPAGGRDTVQSSITFSLASLSLVEDLVLTAGNIDGTGNSADNTITGSTGNNVLNGMAGADSLDGGAGNDGLNGGEGNDTLQGGTGSDSMAGGTGDDLYFVDAVGDVIDETGGDGTDTVNASVNYTLAGGLENLVLSGTATTGTGNDGNNTITGTASANTLSGNGGDDSLDGGAANDTLNGGAGDDTLNGGAGNDSMTGGEGSDTYIVDSTSDVINETGSGVGDVDTILSSIAMDLTARTTIENVTLTGTAAINATGNASNNVITGNAGNNSLLGGAGNDSIVGGGGKDTLDGGLGDDTLIGGTGDDLYIVDSLGDTLSEAPEGGVDTVQSSISYSLAGLAFIEGLTLTGTALSATGNALNNTLTGNAGANTLDGGAGNDTMIGGAGNDTYYVDSATDVVNESLSGGAGVDTVFSSVTFSLNSPQALGTVENLTLTGAADISATGNSSANVIIGNDGDNSINGGAGADTMDGGNGNDTYTVDVAGDVVNDTGTIDSDADRVNASISYVLGAGIEHLTLSGTAANGTGNGLANSIIGNGSANSLSGLAGQDTLNGGAGNDTLDGGTGADVMIGGAGNDTYIVDDLGDVVNESLNAGAGTDIVSSSVSFDLAGAQVTGVVENLTLTGAANINGLGTGTANTITGNAGSNYLFGGGGNDSLVGGAGSDTLDGGEGNDTLVGGVGNDWYVVNATGDVVTEAANGGTDTVTFTGTTGTYTLGSNVENLVLGGSAAISGTGNAAKNLLVGNGANNSLNGGAGNDTLDGGAGNDTMIGGAGNDTYAVDSAGDVVNETLSSGSGIDTVQASVGFSLADTVHAIGTIENLTLLGSSNIDGTGNTLDNRIVGNTGNNVLAGGAGDDFINGGAGADTISGGLDHDQIYGGGGNDVFSYADADFGGSAGALSDHSDDFFDYSAGDKFDLDGLISHDELVLAGGDFNDVIMVTDSGDGVLVVSINEGAALHNSDSADWSTAFNVYGGNLSDLAFHFDGHDWTYNTATSQFEQN